MTFRPLVRWPYADTTSRRYAPFKASYSKTLVLLERELYYLGAENILIGGGWRAQDIRNDGLPRADAREPGHPGIEISFDTTKGRMVYASDVCNAWRDNLRSIALGLESLRAVDRFGITRKGEQYAGWLQIESADDPVVRGRTLVEIAGGVDLAIRQHHPDLGGERADFEAVIAYRHSLSQ